MPDPDSPVITTSLSRGISTSMFFRLCSRAPLMTIFFILWGPATNPLSARRLPYSRDASADRISSAFTLTPIAQRFLAANARRIHGGRFVRGSAAAGAAGPQRDRRVNALVDGDRGLPIAARHHDLVGVEAIEDEVQQAHPRRRDQ